jgi:hypothetical protein
MENKNEPERRFNAGAISATVWKNAGKSKDGAATEFRTISLQRRYKDKNDQWQSSTSMRVTDLPKAALVLNKAFEYLTLRDAPSQQEEAFEEIVM